MKHSITELQVLYQSSDFYQEHQSSLLADNGLRYFYTISQPSYTDVHQESTKAIRNLIHFATEVGLTNDDNDDKKLFRGLLSSIYLDPDSYAIKIYEGTNIKCTADGLLSIKRIYDQHGISNTTVTEYETYRKTPIFFFPSEYGGINGSRSTVFGDRIDHTLFDLKCYFESKTDTCKLIKAYQRPKTKAWLDAIASFKNLINWYGVDKIFTDDNYNVYDIEKGDGTPIEEHQEAYSQTWSNAYYDHLKIYIDKFMNK